MKTRRASISTKILIGFVGVFLVIVTTTGTFQFLAMRREMYGAVETSASNLATMIESLIQEDPNILRRQELHRATRRFTQRVPDVADVMIYDSKGHVVADSDPTSFPGRDPLLVAWSSDCQHRRARVRA